VPQVATDLITSNTKALPLIYVSLRGLRCNFLSLLPSQVLLEDEWIPSAGIRVALNTLESDVMSFLFIPLLP